MYPALCEFLGGGVIAAGGAEGPVAEFPKASQAVGFAEVIGYQLQQRFSALIPELFAAFDAAVDLLDR